MRANVEPGLFYKTVYGIEGSLLIVSNVKNVCLDEFCKIRTEEEEQERNGVVLEISRDKVTVLVFEGTIGLTHLKTSVCFLGSSLRISISDELLGKTIDIGGSILRNMDRRGSDVMRWDVVNPERRSYGGELLETGISMIDLLCPLGTGQSYGIFGSSGCNQIQLCDAIAKKARKASGGNMVVVSALMGYPSESAIECAANRVNVVHKNSDPFLYAYLVPRIAVKIAQYFAFEKNCHVLLMLDDLAYYSECLREFSGRNQSHMYRYHLRSDLGKPYLYVMPY